MKVENVPLSLIDEDIDQPRYTFEEESLKQLAESIKESGLLSPIKVSKLDNGRYKLIYGNRRYKACKLLGLHAIPAIISEELESDMDIYLQQLSENIQRESFTPVEEAQAFEKLLNDNKFKLSRTLLSSRLGKPEKYISQKLDLLVFGKKVQQLVHGDKSIIPNKLSEEQLLPLKNLGVEYRDPLAFKVAAEQVPVKDVKRVAELFAAKDISTESKEILLQDAFPKLLNTWFEYSEEKKKKGLSTEKPNLKSLDSIGNKTDFMNKSFASSEYYQIDIVEKLYELLNSLPGNHKISEDALISIDKIKIANKEEFIRSADSLIDCLTGHLAEWKKVRKAISTTKISIVRNKEN